MRRTGCALVSEARADLGSPHLSLLFNPVCSFFSDSFSVILFSDFFLLGREHGEYEFGEGGDGLASAILEEDDCRIWSHREDTAMATVRCYGFLKCSSNSFVSWPADLVR